MKQETSPKGLSGAQSAKIAELVSYQDGSIVSREIIKNSHAGRPAPRPQGAHALQDDSHDDPILTGRSQSSVDPPFPSFVLTLAATGTTLSISMFSSAE